MSVEAASPKGTSEIVHRQVAKSYLDLTSVIGKQRLLDAGATIAGKAHCEYFCFSGGSHTSAHGAVINPRKPGYSAGGSSSGSGALLAAGEVDLAIGGDQGGSIRMPSSYCGVYGMKPTYGLVPYTGIMPIELTLDHTGPMSRNVSDNTLMLEVIAGPDGLDPRQINVTTDSYTKALKGEIGKLRIGVVKEGFGLANSEPEVDKLVRNGAETFRKLSAKVEEVSIPFHALGIAIWTPIAVEGATMQMMHGNGFGFNQDQILRSQLGVDHRRPFLRPLLLGHGPVADDVLAQHVLELRVAPVLRVAVLQPKNTRRDIGRHVLDVGRVHGFLAVRRHEDLHGFVVIADSTLVERTLRARACRAAAAAPAPK